MIHCEACGSESADTFVVVLGNRERYWEWIDQPPNVGLNGVAFCAQCRPSAARTAAVINGALNQDSAFDVAALVNEMILERRPA